MAQARSLDGKLAIVTGASRGIGSAIAQNLASKGCNVVLNYTSDSSAARTEALAKDLEAKHGVKCAIAKAAVGADGAGTTIVNATTAAFPGKTIDIVVNNAGIAGDDPLETITADVFWRQYQTNVLGPIQLLQAVLPHLPHDRSGRVVNLSSVSSAAGFPGQTVYGGTKAALESMTRTWARELAARCTVNAVNPGPVDTDMYNATPVEFQGGIRPWAQVSPLMQAEGQEHSAEALQDLERRGGRSGKPDEIAGIVGMLCSAESAWCTGSVVCANGGMIMTR